MNPLDLATDVGKRLGGGAHARPQYPFLLPSAEQLQYRTVDAAVFSSPIASINTALVGVVDAGDRDLSANELEEFAYLGAPLLVAARQDRIDLFEYRGSPVPWPLGDVSASKESAQWVRERLVNALEDSQLTLALSAGRELLLRETRGSLGHRLSALIARAKEDLQVNDTEAFAVAIEAVRRALFGASPAIAAEHRGYARILASQIDARSLANLPPEAVAELYESFAVSAHQKRRQGVVYTPAWLARFVIDRLPTDAVYSGRAVDPACGSGTFLVCFLERLVEEAAKRGESLSPDRLAAAVAGVDIDVVATEAARWSLDIFAMNIGVPTPAWKLTVADSTAEPIESEWVIGNLPFGYRTHLGKEDVAAAILRNVHKTNPLLKALSLILPDSFAYTDAAGDVRQLLRTEYRVEEIIRLPESTFEYASTKTMVVVARKAKPTSETLVREISSEDLSQFRTGTYASRSFVSRLPFASRDPWHFSPFSNEFERAERNGVRLSDVADIRIGLQLYGSDPDIVRAAGTSKAGVPLLSDPGIFASWSGAYDELPRLEARREDVRRAGPWDKYDLPKVIVRSTVYPGTLDRLAAIPDEKGLWFTDKFVGIWPEAFDLNALAAFLQTRFARVWFEAVNPSRKLRLNVLGLMPVPRLPASWWERAARLAPSNRVTRPPRYETVGEIDFERSIRPEWEWFNSAVETALGFDSNVGRQLDEWLRETHRVAR